MTKTKFENKMKLWKVLYNADPHCGMCQYWTEYGKIWCRKQKLYPRKNKEIKKIRIEGNNLKISDKESHSLYSLPICYKFKG